VFIPPGPTEYNPEKSYHRPMGKIDKDPRFKVVKPIMENPGPGTYQIPGLMGTGRAWVMGNKLGTVKKREITPGPFEYQNINKMGISAASTAPSYSFGGEMRPSAFRAKEKVPGPGAYRPVSAHSKNPPSYGFGSEVRSRDSIFSTPGPAGYDHTTFVDENMREKKGSSLSFRTSIMSAESTPGPGAYVGKHKIPNRSGITIPKEKKFFYTIQNEKEHKMRPGPGEFDPSKDFTMPNGPQITIPKNDADLKPSEVPGPGEYQPYAQSTVNLSHGPRIGNEPRVKPMGPIQPGPGDYDSHLKPEFFDAKTSFPKMAQRYESKKDDVPGPGKYYKPESTSQGISFTREVKREIDNGVPPPGTYNIRGDIGDVKAKPIPEDDEF